MTVNAKDAGDYDVIKRAILTLTRNLTENISCPNKTNRRVVYESHYRRKRFREEWLADCKNFSDALEKMYRTVVDK